ncbi:TRAP transporter large permease subunit [Synechococcales cyanobacterium C]|uniref:TRAP transporter large permease subunit n=1 Tax=Petrachloros mirabilis ULC683 TaxID=2781853 RepID=A0A8K2A106_9CYAN|nr:SLC13 family permease [Petrachloros mirabilis]NCJ07442.1 TRAP transporter large permease subunit [Petrachloros mirabilis ULC683]
MEIVLTLAIVVGALICFVGEWWPVDITAISVAIVLMVFGQVLPETWIDPDRWITPAEGISGFGNAATITVMAMFILSAGIARTGAIQVISDFLMQRGGKTTSQQIFVLGMVVGPVTAFINNTAVVAVFLPIVENWCQRMGVSPSKLMIPLSYATILGGLMTLIGTSTNILASELSAKLGYGEFSLFQFTKLGMLTFGIGMVYLSVIAPRLLPNRSVPQASAAQGNGYGLTDYVSEVVIAPGSSLIGKTLRTSGIQRKFDLDVLEMIRNGIHFSQPVADKILSAGDILLVRGSREELLKVQNEQGLELLPMVKFNRETMEAEINSGETQLAEVLILANANLIGSTLKDLRFRQRYNATVLAIRRGEEMVRERLGKLPLKFGDLLLVQGPRESFLGLQTSRDLLVMEQRELESLRHDKAGVAIAIALGVILTAAFNWMPILVSSLAGVILMVLTGCLKPGELYGAVRWDIIFLLAGLIPLEAAMRKSGATEWLATFVVNIGGTLPSYGILLFFFVITLLLTEILSNNASVVLMLPIAVEVARTLNLNPYAFMFAVVFAASNSFMTPIGYQTNTMVYGPGGYKFTDFFRVGAPLSFLMALITPPLIILLFGLTPPQ